MSAFRFFGLWAVTWVVAALFPAWCGAASTPVLLRLVGVEGAAPIEIEVRDRPEPGKVEEARAEGRWQISAGETVRTAVPPAPCAVELYSGTGLSPELIGRVIVRYARAAAGWVPEFRLDEEPTVARVNGQWVPLSLASGSPGLLVQHGGTLPNAEGFFRSIEFSLTTGPVAITAWRVLR